MDVKVKGECRCWIPHQGDRIRTYGPLYPKQMRWPDCATPRLTTPEHIDPPDRWTLKPNSPILLGTGTREPIRVINRFFYKICLQQATPAKKPYSAGALTFFGFLFHFNLKIRLAPGYLSFWPKARLEVDSNHWHKDFQSFALTSWATWTTFLKFVFFIE